MDNINAWICSEVVERKLPLGILKVFMVRSNNEYWVCTYKGKKKLAEGNAIVITGKLKKHNLIEAKEIALA